MGKRRRYQSHHGSTRRPGGPIPQPTVHRSRKSIPFPLSLHVGSKLLTYVETLFIIQGVDYPGFYTPDNYERAEKFLEWMTERIHTNGNYASVFMLEVLNEPVHAGDYPSEAADMIQNFYPGAWSRIRAKESELGIAADDQLHIQFMVRKPYVGDN